MEKVKMKLVTENGNAFSLLGVFAAKAREQGWPDEEIKAVRSQAIAGDYDHLLNTLMEHVEHDAED